VENSSTGAPRPGNPPSPLQGSSSQQQAVDSLRVGSVPLQRSGGAAAAAALF